MWISKDRFKELEHKIERLSDKLDAEVQSHNSTREELSLLYKHLKLAIWRNEEKKIPSSKEVITKKELEKRRKTEPYKTITNVSFQPFNPFWGASALGMQQQSDFVVGSTYTMRADQ